MIQTQNAKLRSRPITSNKPQELWRPNSRDVPVCSTLFLFGTAVNNPQKSANNRPGDNREFGQGNKGSREIADYQVGARCARGSDNSCFAYSRRVVRVLFYYFSTVMKQLVEFVGRGTHKFDALLRRELDEFGFRPLGICRENFTNLVCGGATPG